MANYLATWDREAFIKRFIAKHVYPTGGSHWYGHQDIYWWEEDLKLIAEYAADCVAEALKEAAVDG